MWEHETHLSVHKISYLIALDFLKRLFIRVEFQTELPTQSDADRTR